MQYKNRFIKERGELQQALEEGKGNETNNRRDKSNARDSGLKGLHNTVEVSQTDTGH